MEGVVKWFNGRKGYGFIKGDDGKEYFVHFTAVPHGARLFENTRVSFDPAEGREGKLQAQNIAVIEGEEEPERDTKTKKSAKKKDEFEEG